MQDNLPSPSMPDDFIACLKGHASDWFILILILASIATAWIAMQQHVGNSVSTVYIYHKKQLLAYYPLHSPKVQTIHVQGSIGDTEIRIEDGEAFITHAPCSTKICMQKHIHQSGDVIACVPNQILLVMRGQTHDSQRLDGMSQ